MMRMVMWWWRWWHLYYPKVNRFSINLIFIYLFFFQLDRDIKALKFDLNVTDVTLLSSISALLFDVNHVNQTLQDQVCWENSLNASQDVNLGVLTININHPGRDLVHKHKKHQIWLGWRTTRYKVHPNQLNRLKRVENWKRLKFRLSQTFGLFRLLFIFFATFISFRKKTRLNSTVIY